MPLISSFYGILVYIYWLDNKHHNLPHIHVEYNGLEAAFSINEASIIAGNFPPKQTRLVQAWIEIHKEELLADWSLAIRGEPVFKIDQLR